MDCSICLSDLTDPTYKTLCSHIYHLSCLQLYMCVGSGIACPLCRSALDCSDIMKVKDNIFVNLEDFLKLPGVEKNGDIIILNIAKQYNWLEMFRNVVVLHKFRNNNKLGAIESLRLDNKCVFFKLSNVCYSYSYNSIYDQRAFCVLLNKCDDVVEFSKLLNLQKFLKTIYDCDADFLKIFESRVNLKFKFHPNVCIFTHDSTNKIVPSNISDLKYSTCCIIFEAKCFERDNYKWIGLRCVQLLHNTQKISSYVFDGVFDSD